MTSDKLSSHENVTGEWVPPKAELDSLAVSPRPDWAWTFLRRNIYYRSAAQQNRQHWLALDAVDRQPIIFRSIARQLAAEEWGLCTFRRS